MSKIDWENIIEPEKISALIAAPIIEALEKGQRVLWFVPGGSAISLTVLAAKKISAHNHNNLTVTLTDERYGEVGHPDSNWQQMRDAGFNLTGAKFIPVLTGLDFLETARVFNSSLVEAIKQADYIFGFFGIGPDGHTAGILPNSPAVKSLELVSAYDAGNFRRITITPPAIKKIDEIMAFAQGESKWPTLKKLNMEIDANDQPAQILKQAKRLTIFSDYKKI